MDIFWNEYKTRMCTTYKLLYIRIRVAAKLWFFVCELFIRISIVLCADCIVLFHFVYVDICEWKMDIEDWSGWWLLVTGVNSKLWKSFTYTPFATCYRYASKYGHGPRSVCFIFLCVQCSVKSNVQWTHFKIYS